MSQRVLESKRLMGKKAGTKIAKSTRRHSNSPLKEKIMRRHLIFAFIALIVPLLAVAFPETAHASFIEENLSLGSMICASTGFGLLATAICWLSSGPRIRHP